MAATAAPPASAAAAPPASAAEIAPETRFAELLTKLTDVAALTKDIIGAVKALQREHVKISKQVLKRRSRFSKAATDPQDPRPASGFAKPTKLSDELCAFLKIEKGTELPRTTVTKMINDYIKANDLQDPNDKRHIVPDETLAKILSMS